MRFKEGAEVKDGKVDWSAAIQEQLQNKDSVIYSECQSFDELNLYAASGRAFPVLVPVVFMNRAVQTRRPAERRVCHGIHKAVADPGQGVPHHPEEPVCDVT
jgi:hypothetical protein